MKQACIFDMDGTLVKTLESLARPGNRMLEHFGLEPQPLDDYRYHCGDGVDNLVIRLLRAAGAGGDVSVEEAIRVFREDFAKEPNYHVEPYEGIPELLRTLKERGIRTAVCTNKPHKAASLVVDELFEPEAFDVVQGHEEDLAIKPARDIPDRILAKLGLSPADCLYIGDTATDMQTAHAAGIEAVGALWGYRTKEELTGASAKYLITAPMELLDLL